MEGTIGEIRLFGGNFAPLGWAFCDGSLMSIAVYTAAYSIIGDTYGGDSQTTFALPDFRGRIPVGTGAGFVLGAASGAQTATMSTAQMPAHTHVASLTIAIPATTTAASLSAPDGNILASVNGIYSSDDSDDVLAPITDTGNTTVSGSGQPFSIMQPTLGLNYIICLEGVYPSRS